MKNLIIPIFILLSVSLTAQTPISVYNSTIKISPVSEDTMYFSFAKGDQLVFDFESTTGRDLMEFEILKYPHYSKFRKDNQVKMKGEKVAIEETGVYWFRMANRSATERNCKLHIWRIAGPTKKFNTTVGWKTVNDSIYTSSTEKYVSHRDTGVLNREVAMTVQGSQVQWGRTQSPAFDLPDNTIAWSFYVGVNKQGQQVFQDATQKFNDANGSTPRFPGYGPLAALALTGKSYFAPTQTGLGITYSIVDAANVALAQQQQPFKSYRSKKVMNDCAPMKDPRSGKCYFYLYNDTDFAQEVMVKIAAVVVYEQWEERPMNKMKLVKKQVPIVSTNP